MDVQTSLNVIVPDWRNQRISITNESLLTYGPVLVYTGPQKILRQAVIQLSLHTSFGRNEDDALPTRIKTKRVKKVFDKKIPDLFEAFSFDVPESSDVVCSTKAICGFHLASVSWRH
ncbi:hypothetical protein B9Z55_028559 [Caenorhabditis nigoni]|nr:hypothetical protein B9Z55_028559 [Caenorhabditis nigoni]